jgi:hypothetical protein
VYLFRDPMLALLTSVVFVSLLFMTASATAEVFFLKQDLKVSDAVYGLCFAAWTVNGGRRARRGAACAEGGARPGRPGGDRCPKCRPRSADRLAGGLVRPAMWLVGGLGHGAKNVLARTLIQQRVPDRLHGRAFAAYNGLRNGAELFALAGGGLLVAAIGARVTLALAGAVPLLAAGPCALSPVRTARTGCAP